LAARIFRFWAKTAREPQITRVGSGAVQLPFSRKLSATIARSIVM
jgi:hypothetical protein